MVMMVSLLRSSSLLPGGLQIESSEETDQGKYECVASNSAGVRYSSPANLYVRGRERVGSHRCQTPWIQCPQLLCPILALSAGVAPVLIIGSLQGVLVCPRCRWLQPPRRCCRAAIRGCVAHSEVKRDPE